MLKKKTYKVLLSHRINLQHVCGYNLYYVVSCLSLHVHVRQKVYLTFSNYLPIEMRLRLYDEANETHLTPLDTFSNPIHFLSTNISCLYWRQH